MEETALVGDCCSYDAKPLIHGFGMQLLWFADISTKGIERDITDILVTMLYTSYKD